MREFIIRLSDVLFQKKIDEMIRKLLLEMEKHGCPLSRNFYSCGKCSQSTTGYYNLDEGVRGQSLDLINQSIKQRLYSVRTTWPARNNLKRRLYTKPFTHTIIAEHRWTLIIVFMSHVQRFVFVCLLRFIQFALY